LLVQCNHGPPLKGPRGKVAGHHLCCDLSRQAGREQKATLTNYAPEFFLPSKAASAENV
jgi:hypothetical protein